VVIDCSVDDVASHRIEAGDPAWLELPAEAISLVAIEAVAE